MDATVVTVDPKNRDKQIQQDQVREIFRQHRGSQYSGNVKDKRDELEWLRWVRKQFEKIAGEDKLIDFDEFKSALKLKHSFFAERFFAMFDTDKSGTIDMMELMDGLVKLAKGSQKSKLKFLFDVYDVDGSGAIDQEELKTVLRSCMVESSMELSEEALDTLTMTLFTSADKDNSGAISFDELLEELENHPGVMENLTISAVQWLKPPEKKRRRIPFYDHYVNMRYLKNNKAKVSFLFIYLFLTGICFMASAVNFRRSNWCVIIARGCGMALNVNCMFIVVLMLRYCLTWLRSTPVGPYLPIDQSIMFHKICGYVIVILTLGHTAAHMCNIAIVLYYTDPPPLPEIPHNATHPPPEERLHFWEFLFTLRSGIGYVGPGFGYLSGIICFIVLFVMVIGSLGFVRRSGHFQVFYWSHMLYVVFWVFLILHGPIFWYFFIGPASVYVLERIWRLQPVKMAKYGRIYITEVGLLPSKVTHLVLTKPENFHYKSGDYCFLNIPAIAQNEWHPITISSAPELDGKVWFHIRSVGNWTNALYDYFDKMEELTGEAEAKSFDNEAFDDMEQGKTNGHSTNQNGKANGNCECADIQKKNVPSSFKTKRVKVEVILDGPFGTPTRQIFNAEHAVLIGSGIGITPYASILQSIMYRYIRSRVTCPFCQNHWYTDVPSSTMKLKRVDFIWINRDQKSFEWFIQLLSELERQQTDASTEDFLRLQLYMTAAMSKNDIKGLGLQMAMDLQHEQENKDALTGLRTRTQAGRPNWTKVFDEFAAANKGKVKMFYCGSPVLSAELKTKCMKYGFEFSQEHF